jgi:hypothetical protein
LLFFFILTLYKKWRIWFYNTVMYVPIRKQENKSG